MPGLDEFRRLSVETLILGRASEEVDTEPAVPK
jgi:hypothetical protein